MFLKVFVFLLSVKVYESATVICSFQTPCRCDIGSGQAIDLSSVGSPDRPRFYEIPVQYENTTALYSYNPCFAFDSGDKFTTVKKGNSPCKNAAACVRIPGLEDGDPPEEHAIGIQNTAKFLSSENSDMHITYRVPGANQNLTVILKCDNKSLHRLSVDSPERPDNMTVVMTLYSKCACLPNSCMAPTPETPPGGLSAGSKLLIAFFTIVLAYFIIGIVWNFCNGSQGVELIPNLDFWNELPKLIIEGVIFTCSCFGRKRSYGEV